MIGNSLSEPVDDFRRLHVSQCSSTNTLCLDYANQGDPGNLWVTADSQTGGKGSRGRSWVSNEGNLLASLLLYEPCSSENLAELTFVTSVALHEALVSYVGDASFIRLKWPNDVLLNQKKCSGILLESCATKAGRYVVLGIGVNCAHYPDETLHKATSLAAEGIEVSSGDLFVQLARSLKKWLKIWDSGSGFKQVRATWLNHAYGIGQSVTVRIPGQEDICGIFASIDEEGYMLLNTSDKKQKRISTADIFFTS